MYTPPPSPTTTSYYVSPVSGAFDRFHFDGRRISTVQPYDWMSRRDRPRRVAFSRRNKSRAGGTLRRTATYVCTRIYPSDPSARSFPRIPAPVANAFFAGRRRRRVTIDFLRRHVPGGYVVCTININSIWVIARTSYPRGTGREILQNKSKIMFCLLFTPCSDVPEDDL